MSSAFYSQWSSLLGMVCAFACAGCSLMSVRSPPSAPEDRTGKALEACKSYLYPLADTLSVIAGITWVVDANQREHEQELARTASADGSIVVVNRDPSSSLIDPQPERIFGYSVMGLYGISALYGFVVEAQCDSLRRELEQQRAARAMQNIPARRPDPPTDISGFRFQVPVAAAEQTCASKGGEWRAEGTVGHCLPKAQASGEITRLDFEAGAVTKITRIHVPPPEHLERVYDQLYAALGAQYGPPQIDRAPLPADCAGSLAVCLKSGNRPKGATWYWEAASLDLKLAWQNDQSFIEERYTRQERVDAK